jgi:hypothetical protein
MLQVPHVDIQDIVVRTEDDGNVSELLDFASCHHIQPLACRPAILENELHVFTKIPHHLLINF